MRIGIFGGTFDPVHLGHLLLAETAREAGQLDEVWFVPVWQSPLKADEPRPTAKQRVEMLRLAIAGYAPFRVQDLELKRKGTSYTVETLREISGLRPDDKFFLIIGADSLNDFPDWREPDEIARLATIIAMNRGQESASLTAIATRLGQEIAESVRIVQMPAIGISATEIRRRVAGGQSIRYQTLRAVEQYVHQHGIYVPPRVTPESVGPMQ